MSFGTYATALFTLGMLDRLADIADFEHDAVDRELWARDRNGGHAPTV